MAPIRVAIIGTGFGRTVQAVAFRRHPGFELTAIAGSQDEKTRRVAAELAIPHAFGDWRRMLAEARPDLVSIVTPPDLHHPMMLEALAAGSHVLCEKPTALHRHQAAEMRDAARGAGRVAAINHEFRFQPARVHALALARAGGIGVPRRGEILGRYPIWWRPESRAWTWLSDARRGGGVLGALGSHHTDCLRTFFGEPVSALASVRVDQPTRGPTAEQAEARRATADDAFTVEYAFDGATAILDVSACAPYRWERYEIHGSEATLRWDESGDRLWRIVGGHEPEAVEIPPALVLERQAGDPALVAPFGVLIERLRRAIADGVAMDPDFDDAVAVQSALDAVRASSAAGARVHVDVPTPAPA
ncbi:MAG: Gfo/Idh/MocA family oxidoreductase [Candidatus Eisenbacteria bacterium]|uniref:Gfo/Idh/MocA family oxidoreductase n=1 Tax=Eiseniibacteriota bacterium TaxID=2212470 RepID=A0A9D6LAT0_UNCEI|nr:Gfo/Idh/MocA family oxidoreductase [Candidatus Eisenbacteria bacterium]MBI3540145.1 Gfo/Idh/MocA family oxidoreductase [Candidatus Eisenbacteria bacterium]